MDTRSGKSKHALSGTHYFCTRQGVPDILPTSTWLLVKIAMSSKAAPIGLMLRCSEYETQRDWLGYHLMSSRDPITLPFVCCIESSCPPLGFHFMVTSSSSPSRPARSGAEGHREINIVPLSRDSNVSRNIAVSCAAEQSAMPQRSVPLRCH